MSKLSLLLILLLLLPPALALEGSIPLLAVSESAQGLRGSVARLDLEIQEGKGRVFLETSPATKVDTQISMRFAQQIACERARIDCSHYDFIYTITAESGIIGGPSAGAASTALTYAVLTNADIKKDIAVTGTINSGGLIGPVGGLPQKLEAAHNFSEVLIPAGTRYAEELNQTIDLVKYGAQHGIIVKEAEDIDMLIAELTDTMPPVPAPFTPDTQYTKRMQDIAEDLCTRAHTMQDLFYTTPHTTLNESVYELENRTSELLDRGEASKETKDYYSAASFCFRASVNYAALRYYTGNYTKNDIDRKIKLLNHGVRTFKDEVQSKNIQTINELQSAMIVLDRLRETEEYLDFAKNRRDSDISYSLAFATERLYSATSWGSFYTLPGASYKVDASLLKESCIKKIQEAQERYHYVQFYLPNTIDSVKENIAQAMQLQEKGDYTFCLFTAAQAKAQANVVVSVIGASEEELPNIIDRKLRAVERVLARSTEKGYFPIIGYSYYEYAKSLKETDRSSALLFCEYALELGNLDLYFPRTEPAVPAGIITLTLLIIAIILLRRLC